MFGDCHRSRLGDEVRREDKTKGAAAPKRPRPPDWLTPTEAGQPMETRNTTGNTAAKVTKNPQTTKRPPGMMGEISTPTARPACYPANPEPSADRRQTSTPKIPRFLPNSLDFANRRSDPQRRIALKRAETPLFSTITPKIIKSTTRPNKRRQIALKCVL